MKKIKNILLSFLGLMLIVSGTVPKVHAEEPLVIEIVAKGFQHQFWKSVNDGANQAAEKYNAKIQFVGPANETAIQEQVQMLSNAINKKPDAIVLASLDTESQIDLLEQAKNAEIPIIGFDSGVPNAPEGSIYANASTDNYAATGLGAEKVFEAIQEKVKEATVENPIRIGVVSQEVNSQAISDRTAGFIDRMQELIQENTEIDDIAVVGHTKFANNISEDEASVIIDLQVPAQLTDAQGQTAALTLLNKEDIVAIFGTNEFASKGIINANDSLGGVLGKDSIIGAGVDSGALQKNAVATEAFIGSITQDPVQIGYKAVELAVKAAQGEDVEDIDTGAVWYNSENMNDDDIAPLLYD